jgi:pyruvate/2-oxoglutarate dehydrogenase complex dihydrolipoamide dehydrogenase (E3) component
VYKHADTGAMSEEIFDTVLTATGRYADTSKIGLDRVGVATDAECVRYCLQTVFVMTASSFDSSAQ